MNDAALVGLGQRVGDLHDDVYGLIDGAPARDLFERPPLDIFHDDEAVALAVAFDLVDLVDRNYVGVIEGGRRLGFAQEARPRLRVVIAVVEHHLQGDGAAQPRVFSLIIFAHTARSETLDDTVIRDSFADHRVVV